MSFVGHVFCGDYCSLTRISTIRLHLTSLSMTIVFWTRGRTARAFKYVFDITFDFARPTLRVFNHVLTGYYIPFFSNQWPRTAVANPFHHKHKYYENYWKWRTTRFIRTRRQIQLFSISEQDEYFYPETFSAGCTQARVFCSSCFENNNAKVAIMVHYRLTSAITMVKSEELDFSLNRRVRVHTYGCILETHRNTR